MRVCRHRLPCGPRRLCHLRDQRRDRRTGTGGSPRIQRRQHGLRQPRLDRARATIKRETSLGIAIAPGECRLPSGHAAGGESAGMQIDRARHVRGRTYKRHGAHDRTRLRARHSQRSDAKLCFPFPAVELAIEHQGEIGRCPSRAETCTAYPRGAHRPADARSAGQNVHGNVGGDVIQATTVHRKPSGHRAHRAGKAIVERTRTLHSQRNRAIRRRQGDARIGNIRANRGQREARARRCRQQAVECAKRDLAIRQPRPQRDMTDADRGDASAGEPQAGIDLHPVGAQIGIGRIPDDDIGQTLRAQADLLDLVARRNGARAERIVDEILGQRFARQPHAQQDGRQHQAERAQDIGPPHPPCEALPGSCRHGLAHSTSRTHLAWA
ncbi:hypothetical protein D9M73_101340 [compost metagenome]